ncbi:excalibur calcium-binding domain-containing protein [Rhodobacteraceae bacterium LMO-12]|nr:excalibur calcium-binding domain-containing protein [Rhodobacteraceae bacterium LMO-JJ12]
MRLLLICTLVFAVPAFAQHESASNPYLLAQSYSCGKTCGQVRSCKEAVYQWCVCGYRRADGDNDGVPCEKLCGQSSKRNLDRVRKYVRELGCN